MVPKARDLSLRRWKPPGVQRSGHLWNDRCQGSRDLPPRSSANRINVKRKRGDLSTSVSGRLTHPPASG